MATIDIRDFNWERVDTVVFSEEEEMKASVFNQDHIHAIAITDLDGDVVEIWKLDIDNLIKALEYAKKHW